MAPATTPITVPRASSLANSSAGPARVNSPASTTPTRVRVSTVPVTSLKADSAMTVWDTLGLSFRRSNRGMRIAGSVEASTAPMSRATGKATPNTGETTSATITAVMSTPGRTSNPRPTAVPEITRKEMPVPPWNRMSATPMLNRSWAPIPPRGLETSPSTEGPMRAPAATSTTISGSFMTVAMNCERSPAPSMRPKSRRMCSISTLYRTRATSFCARVPQLKCSTLFRRTSSSHCRLCSSGSFR